MHDGHRRSVIEPPVTLHMVRCVRTKGDVPSAACLDPSGDEPFRADGQQTGMRFLFSSHDTNSIEITASTWRSTSGGSTGSTPVSSRHSGANTKMVAAAPVNR